jgi:SAM-dependent methyltransferase
LLGDVVPGDHAQQTLADRYAEQEAGRPANGPWRVLDLGCGAGDSVDVFRARDPDVQWVGLDVPGSPEGQMRTRTDARFETFDGVSMPFGDGAFDLVYCKQVLEHVGHPEPLLAEVRRVLAPGGYFAGSTSQLETYHSLSLWNYTPVGFLALLERADLRPVELRPGIDGLTLIAWRLAGGHPCFHRWWGRESPLNRALDACGRALKADTRTVNATKLLFCGQFAFLARRDPDTDPGTDPDTAPDTDVA